MRLRDLKGLGPKSEQQLIEVGILTPDDLRAIGPVRAFIRLTRVGQSRPSLNFLYAMVGAMEGRHWTDISKSEKGRLLMELEGYQELEKTLQEEGLKIEL